MRTTRKYGERTLHFDATQNEKRKYILVYEGQETEAQYFQGVIDNRLMIGIDPIIDGDKKENIKVERFMPYIRTAVANEKKFCEDILELQDKLGSNIGKLLAECIKL